MAATTFDEFGCDVTNDTPNQTPDMITPDVIFEIDGMSDFDLEMPDGEEVEMWAFVWPEEDDEEKVPAHLMRVRQNDVVHTHLNTGSGNHTIHHHGIEPTPMNDGVGHTSFEVDGEWIYQWQPRYAGTYFYHCHVNTAMHFQFGMYGGLIVDPASGLQRVYDPEPGDSNSVDTSYDVEAIMAVADVDPAWRDRMDNADEGLCGDDVGQNNFRPKYFMVNGVVHPETLTDNSVTIEVDEGDKLLIRLINASYSVIKTKLGGLPATIVGVDGRPLRTNASEGDFSSPISVAANEPVETASAVRYDLIIDTTGMEGEYTVEHEFLQWITRQRDTREGGSGIVQTKIIVS